MVEQASQTYPPMKIECVQLASMSCLNEIIKSHGENCYKIPHMGKPKLECKGRLPKALKVTPVAEDLLMEMEDPEFDELIEEMENENPADLDLTHAFPKVTQNDTFH